MSVLLAVVTVVVGKAVGRSEAATSKHFILGSVGLDKRRYFGHGPCDDLEHCRGNTKGNGHGHTNSRFFP